MKNRLVCSKHKGLKHEQELRGFFECLTPSPTSPSMSLARILSSQQTGQNLVAFSYICLGREPGPSNDTFWASLQHPTLLAYSAVSQRKMQAFQSITEWDCTQRHCNTQKDPMITDHTIVHIALHPWSAPLSHLTTGINHPPHAHWKNQEVVWQHIIHSRVCMEHASPKPVMQVQCAQMVLPFHSAAKSRVGSGHVRLSRGGEALL